MEYYTEVKKELQIDTTTLLNLTAQFEGKSSDIKEEIVYNFIHLKFETGKTNLIVTEI